MSAFLLLIYPLALILGGMLLGWLARWYRYGGRCGPKGLASGVPNVDATRGTVALDGTEPVKMAGTRRAKAADDTRAALDSVKAGYADGKRSDVPGTLADPSPAARVGALAGNAAAAASSVGAGVAEASASASTSIRETGSGAAATVSDAASSAVDSTKSGLASMREGYAEGKAPGETSDSPADGSVVAKVGAVVGGAVASVKGAAASAAETAKTAVEPLRDGTAKERVTEVTGNATRAVKDTASSVTDSTKASLASMRDGYAEGKTADAPAADVSATGSIDGATAKAGDATGPAVTPLRDRMPGEGIAGTTDSAAPSSPDTVSSVTDGTRSHPAPLREGHAEGRVPGETVDAPADGSVAAKVGAVVGGAVASVKGAAASAAETAKSAVEPLRDGTAKDKIAGTVQSTGDTVKGAASGAVDSTKSGLASMREGYAEGKAPGETPDTPADGSVVAKVGAVVGGAVASVKGVAASAAETAKSAVEPLRDGTAKDKIADVTGNATQAVKDTASGAADSTKSGLASMREGYVEGKAPGETPDAPADGSVVAKVGSVVGGAVASVKGVAASAAETAKSAVEPLRDGTAKDKVADTVKSTGDTVTGAASGAVDGTKSGLASMREGYAEGKAPGETPEAPAGGSVLAKVGAVVGGAVASTAGAVSGAVETAKAATTRSDDPATSDTADEAVRNAARHDRGLPGATIGQEDGHVPTAEVPAPRVSAGSEDDATGAASRTRFATVTEDPDEDDVHGGTTGSGIPASFASAPFDDIEEEARRLIDSGEEIGKPGNTLAAPASDRAPDDLKRISGVGPRIERTLNDEGIYYFDQVADFTARDLAWADRTLGFHGRVVRDRWIPQARLLAAERAPDDAAGGTGTPVGHRVEPDASGDAPVNMPLHPSEIEAMRLIEREGGYAATAQNRPDLLMRDGPVGGKPDDLKRIKGIGKKLEKVLNGLGVYYFRQIAAFSADDMAWVDSKLKFKGRIVRDRWVPQAELFERNRDV